jgi:prepilin-type N-terminal cleavage/methylation domain-containing protein
MSTCLLRRSDAPGASGFTLVELLVAAAVTAVVLAAAYGWVWNVAALATRTDDRAQAATIAAACCRAVELELRRAVAIVQPPTGRDPATSLALVHDHIDTTDEEVLVVWDPARRVVWRNASGTYLADHVTRFAVTYVLGDGRLVAGDDMPATGWEVVRCVSVDLAVGVGSATEQRTLVVAAGSS